MEILKIDPNGKGFNLRAVPHASVVSLGKCLELISELSERINERIVEDRLAHERACCLQFIQASNVRQSSLAKDIDSIAQFIILCR